MKKTIGLTGVVAHLLLFHSCYAQSTAAGSVMVTNIIPITIIKDLDMSFGNVAASPSSPGRVILSPTGTRVIGGAVALPANTGVVSAASFTVLGQTGYTYAVTLPSSCTIIGAGSNAMTVDRFTSTPSEVGILSSSGSQVLKVGATLNVNAGQAIGIYRNISEARVTVNYN